MKYIVIGCLIQLFTGCTPEDFVRDNSRNLIEGNIVATNGDPLSGIDIVNSYDINNFLNDSFNFEGQTAFPSNTDPILGNSFSDSNGDFSFSSLVSVNNQRVNYVIINKDIDESLQSVIYILDQPFTGEINLPEITLAPKAQFQLNIERTTTEPLALFYTIEFQSDREIFFLSGNNEDELSAINGEIAVADNSDSIILNTLIGGSVIFSFSIFNEGELVESDTQNIMINENNQTFEFEF